MGTTPWFVVMVAALVVLLWLTRRANPVIADVVAYAEILFLLLIALAVYAGSMGMMSGIVVIMIILYLGLAALTIFAGSVEKYRLQKFAHRVMDDLKKLEKQRRELKVQQEELEAEWDALHEERSEFEEDKVDYRRRLRDSRRLPPMLDSR